MQRLYGGQRVDLGDLTLGGVDDAGVGWHIATLEGWDSAEVRSQITQREADHGAWAGPTYLGERPVTLTGTIDAPSRAALDDAIERILAACSIDDTVLTVYESVPKQAIVRRSGKPVVQRRGAYAATYSLLVTAADPRRYSTQEQSQSTALPSVTGGLVLPATLPWTLSAVSATGAIAAVNGGTFATRPVLEIAGPVDPPQVAALYPDGTVRMLTYDLPLLAGEVLVIDTDAHTATVGGASRRRWLHGPWPDIPAESSVLFQFLATYNPDATLTATWRSAWT